MKLFTTFYDLSVSRDLFLKVKMRQIGAPGTEGLTADIIVNHNFVISSGPEWVLRAWGPRRRRHRSVDKQFLQD